MGITIFRVHSHGEIYTLRRTGSETEAITDRRREIDGSGGLGAGGGVISNAEVTTT
ncbi:MAG: hypothetical protein JXA98_00360 [Methanosarcinaceae archaeon]|nr:hypothetical protein [Methanosarcinaceae archaeon]